MVHHTYGSSQAGEASTSPHVPLLHPPDETFYSKLVAVAKGGEGRARHAKALDQQITGKLPVATTSVPTQLSAALEGAAAPRNHME